MNYSMKLQIFEPEYHQHPEASWTKEQNRTLCYLSLSKILTEFSWYLLVYRDRFLFSSQSVSCVWLLIVSCTVPIQLPAFPTHFAQLLYWSVVKWIIELWLSLVSGMWTVFRFSRTTTEFVFCYHQFKLQKAMIIAVWSCLLIHT